MYNDILLLEIGPDIKATLANLLSMLYLMTNRKAVQPFNTARDCGKLYVLTCNHRRSND